MDKNELVVKIANDAISHIRDFALDAIRAVSAEVVEIETRPVADVPDAPTESKRGRGRPRNVEVEKPPVQEVEVTEEACGNPASSMEEVFDVSARLFPDYSDEWFAADIEASRKICRDILTDQLAVNKGDANVVQADMMKITGQGRVSAFDAASCAKYYRAMKAKYSSSDLM